LKVSYKGYEIDTQREESLGGYDLLYWSIFRKSDGYEADSGFTTGDDSMISWIKGLKQRVDAELAGDNPWNENEDNWSGQILALKERQPLRVE